MIEHIETSEQSVARLVQEQRLELMAAQVAEDVARDAALIAARRLLWLGEDPALVGREFFNCGRASMYRKLADGAARGLW